MTKEETDLSLAVLIFGAEAVRRVGDAGLHRAVCNTHGELRRGSYGMVETEAAIHRAAHTREWCTVRTYTLEEPTP